MDRKTMVLVGISVALAIFGFAMLRPDRDGSVLVEYDNVLFYSDTCPYSQMVLNYIDTHDVDVKKLPVSEYYDEYQMICREHNNGKCGVPLYVRNQNVYMGVSDVIRAMSGSTTHS